MAAAVVVGAFNEAVKLLLRGSSTAIYSDNSSTFSAATSPRQAPRASSPSVPPLTGTHFASAAAEPALSAPLKSPPLSPHSLCIIPGNASGRKQGQQSSCMMMATPSPPCYFHSPLRSSATTSDNMSEGSPTPPVPHLPVTDAHEPPTTSANPLKPDVSRKRGYYRCTHKTDVGCPAVKQVQRCDEEETHFEVTYRGYHTCRPGELDQKYWPFAFPRSLFNLAATGSTSAQELSSMLSFSNSTATSAAVSLTQQLASMAANSAASQLQLGSTAGAMSINQLTSLANELTSRVINADYSRVNPASSGNAVQQEQMNVGNVSMSYSAQVEQGRVFSPLADWSSLDHHRNRAEGLYKRPFTKVGTHATETQHVLPRSLLGGASGACTSGSSMPTMIVVTTAHEQMQGVSSEQPAPPNSMDDQEHRSGTTAGSTPQLITFDDDMENDNLFSDYVKSFD